MTKFKKRWPEIWTYFVSVIIGIGTSIVLAPHTSWHWVIGIGAFLWALSVLGKRYGK